MLSDSCGAFSLTLLSLGLVGGTGSLVPHSDKSVLERMGWLREESHPFHGRQVKAFDINDRIALFVQPR